MKKRDKVNEDYNLSVEEIKQQEMQQFLNQTMRERYRKIAAAAAYSERAGNYHIGAKLWMDAMQVATGINRDWCESRMARCQLNSYRIKMNEEAASGEDTMVYDTKFT
ncbi:ANR family transcriptional regulator [Citrobacter koseri]